MPACADFLERLFSHPSLSDLFLYTWELGASGGGRSKSFLPCRKSYAQIEKEMYGRANAYFGLSMTSFPLRPEHRATKETAAAIPAFWLDVDVAGDAHKKENLPPTLESIKPLMEGTPAPTFVISSGHGYHFYWVLEEPILINSEFTRTWAETAVRTWNEYFKARFAAAGYNLDSTSTAQVLRLPETRNTKLDPAEPVKIVTRTPDAIHAVGVLHAEASAYLAENNRVTPAPARAAGEVVTPPDFVPEGLYEFKVLGNAEIDPDMLTDVYLQSKSFKDIWSHQREYPSQSERDLAIAAHLMSMGATHQEIVDGLIQNWREHGQRTKLRSDYFQRTLWKAEQSDLVRRTRVLLEKAGSLGDDAEPDDGVPAQAPADDEARALARANMKGLLGLRVERFVKILTSPPTYRLEFWYGKSLRQVSFATIKDVRSKSYFLDRIMEVTNQYLVPPKKQVWDKFMEELLPFATEESTGETGTESGVFRQKVRRYLDFQPPAALSEDEYMDLGRRVLDGRPYLEKAGEQAHVFLDPEDFQRWHNREGQYPERLKLENISVLLISIGGKSVTVGKPEGMRGRPRRFRLCGKLSSGGEFVL